MTPASSLTQDVRLLPTSSSFVASDQDAGRRLDQFLTARLPDVSRAQVQRLIADGHVPHRARQDQVRAWRSRPDSPIDVDVPAPRSAAPRAEALPLTILYDDADMVVVDKPAGMVVHPAAGHAAGTLVNALLHHVSGLSGIGGDGAAGHRASARSRHVGRDGRRQARSRASRARAAVSRSRGRQGVRRARVGHAATPVRCSTRAIGRDPRHRQKMSSRARRAKPAT